MLLPRNGRVTKLARVPTVLVLLALAWGSDSCKTVKPVSAVKDNEALSGSRAKLNLGYGIKVLPGQPAQGVCVAKGTVKSGSTLGLDDSGASAPTTTFASDQVGSPGPGDGTTTNTDSTAAPTDDTQAYVPAPDSLPASSALPLDSNFEQNVDVKGTAIADVSGDDAVLTQLAALLSGGSGNTAGAALGLEDAAATAAAAGTGTGPTTSPMPALPAMPAISTGDPTAISSTGTGAAGSLVGDVTLVISEEQMNSATSLSAQISATSSFLSGGLSGEVKKAIHDLTNHSYIVFKLQFLGSLDAINVPVMTDLATSTVGTFYDRCGDRYIADRLMGGFFFGVAEIDKIDSSTQKDINGAITDLSSSYLPSVKGGAKYEITSSVQKLLQTARFQFYRMGGSNQSFALSLDGMIAASRNFVETVGGNQQPIVAFLKTYAGLVAASDLPARQDPVTSVNKANRNIDEATKLIQLINGYPAAQLSSMSPQLKILNDYVTNMQTSIANCQNGDCAISTLEKGVPLTRDQITPPIANVTWKAGQWYTIPVYYHGVYCNFNSYGGKYYALNKVFVQFNGQDLTGNAAVEVQQYMWPNWLAGANSPIHVTNIAKLAPYLKGIVGQNLSNDDLAAFTTQVIAPLTSSDGGWSFKDCTGH